MILLIGNQDGCNLQNAECVNEELDYSILGQRKNVHITDFSVIVAIKTFHSCMLGNFRVRVRLMARYRVSFYSCMDVLLLI